MWGAMEILSRHGWDPFVMPHAFDRHGTFAGTLSDRLCDLRQALLAPTIRAIICSRGGYGAVQLLEYLDTLPLRNDPKWLVGFSDITALHALMARHGIISVHSPMCRHLAMSDADDMDTARLLGILEGETDELHLSPTPLNRPGEACGTLVGGNLAVLSGLAGTPFDPLLPGTILFIEDIAEPIYKVERMLYNLRLRGLLQHLAGLIVGQFTLYEPSRDYPDMNTMIADMTSDYNYPIVFNAPIGHVPHNTPLLHGAMANLSVDHSGATLRYITTAE